MRLHSLVLIGVGMDLADVRCLFTEGEALKVAVVMTVVAIQ